jgi:hypothetical protein
VRGRNLHDLLPLPYTEQVLAHVCERVRRVQDRLGRRIALENPSSYFAYRADAIPEAEFLAQLAERADCGILLDVNNVFVSAHNHGFDAEAYLAQIPRERVFQIHLAGHSRQRSLLIDTHDHPVCDEVWALYECAVRRLGPVSTLIEWDERIPELEVLTAEAARAREILVRIAGEEKSHGAGFPAGQLWRLIAAPSGVEPVAGLLRGDANASSAERLGVYANAYFARLHDCLAEDFGATARALGSDAFHDLVKTYLMIHPPQRPSLHHAGTHLAEHLATPPFAAIFARRCSYAADLARLEWAIARAFTAPDAPVLERAALAAVAPDEFAGCAFP